MYLLAGLIAATVAYSINRLLVRRFGIQVIVFITPILEEGLKTGLAFFFRTSILSVHLLFGMIEGIYDLITAKQGISAGLMSVVWHGVFGGVTIFVSSIMGNLVYGLLAAIFLHYIGNNLVVNPKEERR